MIHMDHVFEVKTGCPAKEYPELQQLFADKGIQVQQSA